jgi:hypothetical protein
MNKKKTTTKQTNKKQTTYFGFRFTFKEPVFMAMRGGVSDRGSRKGPLNL